MEFNLRLKKMGARILLVPEIVSYYYARSDLKSFIKHNFIDGMWAILPFKYTDVIPISLRHLVPLIFVSSLILFGLLIFFSPLGLLGFLLVFGSYSITNLYFSVKITIREKNLRLSFVIPIMFATLHLGYGLDSV